MVTDDGGNTRNKVTNVTGRVLLQEGTANAKGKADWKALIGSAAGGVGVCALFWCEAVSKFLRERRKGKKAELIGTQVASGNGVGRIVSGSDVFEYGGDEGREQDGKGAADGHVDVEVAASALVHSTNGTLVIRVNEHVTVGDAHAIDNVDHQLNGHSFQPANVTAWEFPVWGEAEGSPVGVDDDADAP